MKDPSKQQQEFIARIIQNLPRIHPLMMQLFIQFPVKLQELLWNTFLPFTMVDVVTRGYSGEDWILILEQRHYQVDAGARRILSKMYICQGPFEIAYPVVIIRGDEFNDEDRTIANIRTKAYARGLSDLPTEFAPYLRELISDADLQKMGLVAIVAMHESVPDNDGNAPLLIISRHGAGRRFQTTTGFPSAFQPREYGFAFFVYDKARFIESFF